MTRYGEGVPSPYRVTRRRPVTGASASALLRVLCYGLLYFRPAFSMPDPPQFTPSTQAPICPKCQGLMWDNREGKRNPKAPDFKCKDPTCDGVIWPPRDGRAGSAASASTPASSAIRASAANSAPGAKAASGTKARSAPSPAGGVDANGMPLCPICGGAMWDDRESKRNPRAPDFKCRDKPRERGGPGCEGVIWPARDGSPSPYPPPIARRSASGAPPRFDDEPLDAPPFDDAPPLDDDDLPF